MLRSKFPRANSLPAEILAGQLLIPDANPRFCNTNSAEFKEALRLVERFHISGLSFFSGRADIIRFWTHKLNESAEYPLIFAADLERGLRSVLGDGTLFPHAMCYGAADDPDLVHRMATATAREARAIGINMIYGPVLDISENPDDRIINIRSYHGDPEMVKNLAAAFIDAVQRLGIACVGKHFPGHGAASVDSHISIPEVPENILDESSPHMVAFESAINAGVMGLMPGHLRTSGSKLPASMDPHILRYRLRDTLDFDRVIVTDALNMGAITENFTAVETALAPIEASADLLLMPERLETIHSVLVKQINDDPMFRKTVEQSVDRIFRLKRWIAKKQPQSAHPNRIYKTILHPVNIALSQQSASKGITLLKKSPQFPVRPHQVDQLVHLVFTDISYHTQPLEDLCTFLDDTFVNTKIYNNPKPNEVDFSDLTSDSVLIFSLYTRTFGGNTGSIDKARLAQFLKQSSPLPTQRILLVHGNPYALNPLDDLDNLDSILLTYSYVRSSQLAAGLAICGWRNIAGKLPIKLKQYRQGAGETEVAQPNVLMRSNSRHAWQSLRDTIEAAIADKKFPGCVVLAARRNQVFLEEGFGRFEYEISSKQVECNTAYDLASLTKVLATTPAIMRLLERQKLSLNDQLVQFYPGLEGTPRSEITIADLLSHQSGLPAWKPLYEAVPDQAESSTAAYVNAILEEPLEYVPGEMALYSDLGFILLQDIVEKTSGASFKTFCDREIFEPLGLNSIQFIPTTGDYPPTGTDALRSKEIIGTVNDANCFGMGGIGGHAGLFGNAFDIAAFAAMVIQGGIYGTSRHFKHSTIHDFSQKYNPQKTARALGWDTPTKNSSSGEFFSENSIGHLGFTGTSLWIDLKRKVIIVMLSNRVHGDPDTNRMQEIRPLIHNEIMSNLPG